ncbi:MAG: hypothetical protein IPM53_29845 [Anaerolineaceae bacterium]|nr:hypothetical protein [Anaerolineaceae bacterium]
MSQFIEYSIEDSNKKLFIEIETPEIVEDIAGISATPNSATKAPKYLNNALDAIEIVSNSIVRKMGSMEHIPNDVTVTFGIKFDAKSGAIIAKSPTDSTFNITLTWTKD